MDPLLSPADFAAGTKGQVREDDPRLVPLLNGASAAVRRHCRWHVTPEIVETVILDGPGGDLLVLPTMRIVSIGSVKVGGVELDVDELEWSANGEIRLGTWGKGCRGYGWGTRFRSIEITTAHGFAATPDLVEIVRQVVANAIASPLGATFEQAGAVSVSWATTAPGVSGGISLLERDLAILDTYRLPQGA